MTNQRTALILGATGGVGGETAQALQRHGWRVRALARRPIEPTQGIDWLVGDALDAAAVSRAAEGVSVIVHAVNPPGYRDWATLAVPMLENSIAAARASGARVALPGTIYNYDPAAVRLAAEDAPQHPSTRKGRIRVAMEQRLDAASAQGVRSLTLRAGDFFGPRPGNSWLSQGMVTPGKPVRSVVYPGMRGIGHGWAYLPDVGETFAQLLGRDAELPDVARFHLRGVWDADGTVMTAAIGRAVGLPDLKVRRFPWGLLPLAAPFSETMREMIEMRTLWQHPLELDNSLLVGFLGAEPSTPIDVAMRTTLEALGCLDRTP